MKEEEDVRYVVLTEVNREFKPKSTNIEINLLLNFIIF